LFRERTGRDVKLVLTGSGEIRPPPELAPHIMDLGFVPEPDKHEAMAGAIAFCHPSTLESFSIVLLESWLAQTPALVHAQCDVTRFHCQASGGGLWFRVYPEFEEALMGLMDHASLRKAMGLAGHRYALREYSWDAIDAKLFATLDL